MTAGDSPGPGWWQASDGNWYPPETHPDYQPVAFEPPAPPVEPAPMAPTPPAFQPPALPTDPAPMAQTPPAPWQPPHAASAPSQAPTQPAYPAPAPVYGQPAADSKPFWQQPWLLAVLGIAVLLGIFAVVRASGGSEQADDALTTESNGLPQRVPLEDDGDQNAGAADRGSGALLDGSIGSAYGYGSAAPVVLRSFGGIDESTWNVTVSEIRDMTTEITASNEYNDPAPDGILFVGFDVEMVLASAAREPVSPALNIAWEVLGGETNSVYDESTIDGLYGCGYLESEFDGYAEVFVSGTLAGTVCIPVPAADFGHPDTRVSLKARDYDRLVFDQVGITVTPAAVGSPGPVAASTELSTGVAVPVTVDGYGDADGSVWNTRVGDLRDITAQIVEADGYASPPRDGIVFAGFEADMTLAMANAEPLAPGLSMTWEIHGGATAAVYQAFTMRNTPGCGPIDGEFGDGTEVFVGGSLSGTVCIPLPAEDLDHPNTRLAINFGDNRVVFADSGPTPLPADIRALGGPEGVGNSHPVNEPVDIEWTSYDEGDGSIWATTVTAPLRDITDEVLAANEFNTAPSPGVILAGFDVELTLRESDEEPLSAGFVITWEVLGGATNQVYDAFTVPEIFGCGAVDGEFNDFAQVFVGGSLAGTICIPIPAEDLGHPDTRIALNFSGERRVTFASN